MTESSTFIYSGTELDLFATARHWKSYWTQVIDPYLGQHVLELGAGIGANAQALQHRRYARWLSVEPDATMVELMKQGITQGRLSPSHEAVCGTSLDLSRDERFDTILYLDVLEHIEDDHAELQRVSGLLQPGGHIVILAPAHNVLYTPFDRKIGHFRRYDKAMLRAIVPPELHIRRMLYLDSVGMLASLANKLLLQSDSPSPGQVRLWDSVMVRMSRLADPLTGFQLGKSIVCILQKPLTL
ncbi:bifunctional 2-polyprenyl-6-hydroxyphenol methylase/3-demethylubiquinol 3-O-methyltransferase UbiG [Hydrogenophaga sp. H7]|uniref:class I SAM-dependent methyltransferase n=1 Tax=Hydrogenophaga sp. H7 TaxID=1882399 RepID=UPI0009C9CE07|nr:class I SAM-dependent methyltransferase [Hydrogenophaga sp. H7]OPF63508.1 methyltransferase type 12 [Hydrogenophaga sp. H7]